MGFGIARFGRRGLKTTETWKLWSEICPQGFWGAAHLGFRGTAPWGFEGRRRGFEGQRQGVSMGSAKGFRGAAPLIKDLIYHFALSLEVPSDYQGPRGMVPWGWYWLHHSDCTTVHMKFSHKIDFFYTIQPTYRSLLDWSIPNKSLSVN